MNDLLEYLVKNQVITTTTKLTILISDACSNEELAIEYLILNKLNFTLMYYLLKSPTYLIICCKDKLYRIIQNCLDKYFIDNRDSLRVEPILVKNGSMHHFTDSLSKYAEYVFRYGLKDSKYKIIKLMLDGVIDVHLYYDAAFMYVIRKRDMNSIKKIIEMGTSESVNGRALKNACSNGYLDVVEFLLNYGVAIDDTEYGTLTRASENGHDEIVKLLLERGADAKRTATILGAATSRNINIIRLLLENGADVHTYSDYLIRHNAKFDEIDIIRLLLEKGADIHAKNDAALRHSAKAGHTKIVKLLIENGANIHALDNYALCKATKYAHYDTIKLLLERGADPKKDYRPLSYGIESGRTEIVKLLIDCGADIHMWGEMPVLWAGANGKIDMLKLLMEHGADLFHKSNNMLSDPIRGDHIDMIKFMLENGVKPYSYINDYDRIKYYSEYETTNSEIILLLLENGATIDSFKEKDLVKSILEQNPHLNKL